MADAAQPVSSWAPLRFTVFRAFWIAVLVGNIGSWMQTVGAQWFLVHAANAAILVALVQVADTLPDALFGLVGGVLADLFDRRRLLLVVQLGLGLVAVALAVLTFLGQMTAPLLIAFTFALGSASVSPTPPSNRSSRISSRARSCGRPLRSDRSVSTCRVSSVRRSPAW